MKWCIILILSVTLLSSWFRSSESQEKQNIYNSMSGEQSCSPFVEGEILPYGYKFDSAGNYTKVYWKNLDGYGMEKELYPLLTSEFLHLKKLESSKDSFWYKDDPESKERIKRALDYMFEQVKDEVAFTVFVSRGYYSDRDLYATLSYGYLYYDLIEESYAKAHEKALKVIYNLFL